MLTSLQVAAGRLVRDTQDHPAIAVGDDALSGDLHLATQHRPLTAMFIGRDHRSLDGDGHARRPVHDFNFGLADEKRFAIGSDEIEVPELDALAVSQRDVFNR